MSTTIDRLLKTSLTLTLVFWSSCIFCAPPPMDQHSAPVERSGPMEHSEDIAQGVLQEPPHWKVAVVFHLQGSQRIYQGVYYDPILPSELVVNSPTQTPGRTPLRTVKEADYEIWIGADGKAQDLWYSSRSRTFGVFFSGAPVAPEHSDRGLLQRIVNAAKPDLPQPDVKPEAFAYFEYMLLPHTLDEFCKTATVICTGRIVGVLREAHTPINAPYAPQHMVYLLAVEQYLKKDTPEGSPVLKVWQPGGALSWKNSLGGKDGKGYAVADDPMLDVGSRYCLFLRPVAAGMQQFIFGGAAYLQKLGYVPGESEGIRGKVAELDEYGAVEPLQAKLWLKNGMASAPRRISAAHTHWRFSVGPQILDVTEEEALTTIKQKLAELDFLAHPKPVTIPPDNSACLSEFVYVAHAPDSHVFQYCVRASGRLQPLSPPSIFTGLGPTCVAVQPSGRFAYVTNRFDNSVAQYKVAPDGHLQALSPSLIQTPHPIFMAIHPSGQVAYVVNELENTISQYYTQDNGTLKALSPPTVGTGRHPTALVIDPGGHFVYTINRDDHSISQYGVNSDGSLSLLSPAAIKTPDEPVNIVLDPTGRFAYVILDNKQIAGFRVSPTGPLEAILPLLEPYPNPIKSITVHNDIVYLTYDTTVLSLRMGADGRLSPTNGVAKLASNLDNLILTRASASVLDPSGRFLYVLTRLQDKGSHIRQFRVLPDGRLQLMEQPEIDISTDPRVPTSISTIRLPYQSAPGSTESPGARVGITGK